MNKNILLLCLGLTLGSGLSSCFDLNKEPEGTLSTTKPFASTGEMQNYLNMFYESGLRTQGFSAGGGAGIAGDDVMSDNMTSSAVNTRLDGRFSLSNAASLTTYVHIRDVNYLLTNLENTTEKGSARYNQCVGEAYYFRAWYYYTLLTSYGGVTWLSEPLDPVVERLQLPRHSRLELTDSILADLDRAIGLLGEQQSAASMRVHRDVAWALKSEVALFEATWERYHKAKGDAFADPQVTEEKIKGYLMQALEAAKAVVDRGVWKVYSASQPTEDYRQLFQTTDLSANPEILWYKRYDGNEVGNNVNRYLNQGGGGIGLTASLVDDYLTRDGRPFVGAERLEAKKTFGTELQPTLRDPRLAQTVCTPGQRLRPDQPAYEVPPLLGASYHQNMTGYSLLKHVQIDYTGNLDAEYKGATPAIQFRYADILLNYAEALVELDGATHAAEVIKILHPLRARVGMPDVDFDREYNTEADYSFRHLNKYVQAVRRERRVEQACEGRRFRDIARWAAAEELIVGQRAVGALFVGSNLKGHPRYGNRLVYDAATGNNLFLTGKAGDSYRYILPSNPAGHEAGWGFNPKRDYLLPINLEIISATGGKWTQNPGW